MPFFWPNFFIAEVGQKWVGVFYHVTVANQVAKTTHRIHSGVTRGGLPRVTPSRGMTPEGKKFVGKFTKNSGETRSDR